MTIKMKMAANKQADMPIAKSDIRWGKEDVSMKREKFEALIGYLQEVSQRLVEAEDELSFQRYDTRKAEKEADFFLGLSASLSATEKGIQKWLEDPKNSIQELSRRTGIPYATCHRIVRERLGDARIETGQLKKLAKAIGEKPEAPEIPRAAEEQQTRDAFTPLLGAQLARTLLPENSRILGVSAKGNLVRKVKEAAADVVLVDVASSKLSAETWKALGEFAAKSGTTMVLTGMNGKRKAEPMEKILAVGAAGELRSEKG